jgi:Uma2 family endonuclease
MNVMSEKRYTLPIYFPYKEEMSRDDFLAFCAANSHLRIEKDEDNHILIMPPVFGETGRKHLKIASAIDIWNTKTNSGVAFDSSTGFDLPDGSMRSPDAAWITKEKWERLSMEERNAFLPFAPDFVVEILSTSDHMAEAKKKMNKWIENGTQLSWLIIPQDQQTLVYRADGTVDKIFGFDKKLSGENVLPGFEFDLSIIM